MTDSRARWRVAALLFAVAWGANHFAALLGVYRLRLGLDASEPALLFAMYAIGLLPGLLFAGPLSDRYGRRAIVLPCAMLALLASLLLGVSGAWFGLLMWGRLLYGLAAGGVMSAGAAWLVELSSDATGTGARRATIALSSGFGLGPLVAGTLAQFAPYPTLLPYLVHAAVLIAALLFSRGAPEAAPEAARRAEKLERSAPLLRIELDAEAWKAFWMGVAPMAPFVFGFAVVAFAALPSVLDGALGSQPLLYTGVLSGVTLAAGVLAQPLTRNLAPSVAGRLGLACGTCGLLLSAFAVATQTSSLLLLVALMLGAAYGVCMTAGLQQVQRLARPAARGGITGLYYVLTYVGFAVPYLLALGARVATPATGLCVMAALAALVALLRR